MPLPTPNAGNPGPISERLDAEISRLVRACLNGDMGTEEMMCQALVAVLKTKMWSIEELDAITNT